MEKGTLFQLRNVINRRNVSAKPKADVNAAEDFFEIAGYWVCHLHYHVVSSDVILRRCALQKYNKSKT